MNAVFNFFSTATLFCYVDLIESPAIIIHIIHLVHSLCALFGTKSLAKLTAGNSSLFIIANVLVFISVLFHLTCSIFQESLFREQYRLCKFNCFDLASSLLLTIFTFIQAQVYYFMILEAKQPYRISRLFIAGNAVINCTHTYMLALLIT